MRILALLAFLVPALPAWASPPPTSGLAHIGDLQLAFDAGRWAIDGAGSAYTIECRVYDCFRTVISVTVVEGSTCTTGLVASEESPSFPDWAADFESAGLAFFVREHDLGCRNWAGGPVRACTAHAGKTYVFDAPGNGCRTSRGNSNFVTGILMGLSPR